MTKAEALNCFLDDDQQRKVDFAVPQDWANDVEKVTGFNPACFTVWDYNSESFMGRPRPLTCQGAKILGDYYANLS